MARVGVSSVRIADHDGDVATVTNNKLDVNATLVAGATIDIGDVDMFLDGGTAILGGAGAVAAGVLRVTLASDDVHFGAVGEGAASDGTIHGQLRYIGSQVNNQYSVLSTIDADTSSMNTNLGGLALCVYQDDADWSDGSSYHLLTGGLYQSTPQSVTDGDVAPFQIDSSGRLLVTGGEGHGETVGALNFTIMGEAKIIDGSALPNTVAEGRNARLAASRAGIAYTCLTDDAGASDLGETIANHLSEIEGAVETIEAAVTFGTFVSYPDFEAATTETAISDSTNGVNASITDAKEIIIQTDDENTGYIMVGSSGNSLAGSVGSRKGIKMNGGETLVLNYSTFANIFIDASGSSQYVNVAYFK